MMSGRARAAALLNGSLVLALKAPLAWSRLVREAHRRRRMRMGVAALPMSAPLVHDLGLVQADVRRLGLLA